MNSKFEVAVVRNLEIIARELKRLNDILEKDENDLYNELMDKEDDLK